MKVSYFFLVKTEVWDYFYNLCNKGYNKYLFLIRVMLYIQIKRSIFYLRIDLKYISSLSSIFLGVYKNYVLSKKFYSTPNPYNRSYYQGDSGMSSQCASHQCSLAL